MRVYKPCQSRVSLTCDIFVEPDITRAFLRNRVRGPGFRVSVWRLGSSHPLRQILKPNFDAGRKSAVQQVDRRGFPAAQQDFIGNGLSVVMERVWLNGESSRKNSRICI